MQHRKPVADQLVLFAKSFHGSLECSKKQEKVALGTDNTVSCSDSKKLRQKMKGKEFEPDKPRAEDVEKSLCQLTKMAANIECIPFILDGMNQIIQNMQNLHSASSAASGHSNSLGNVSGSAIVINCDPHSHSHAPRGDITQQVSRVFATLIKRIVQTCYEEILKIKKRNDSCVANGRPGTALYALEEVQLIMKFLTSLCDHCAECLKLRSFTHFTAVATLNRIADLCYMVQVDKLMLHCERVPNANLDDFSLVAKPDERTGACRKGSNVSASKRGSSYVDDASSGFPSLSASAKLLEAATVGPNSLISYATLTGLGILADIERLDEQSKLVIPLQRILMLEPALIMSLFDSARLRMQTSVCQYHSETKASQDSHLCSVAGVSPHRRAPCLPSQRVSTCAHCLLVLLTRLLVIISHDRNAQSRFVNGGHMRLLVESLDTNNDPHFLFMLLQCLANFALNVHNHSAMLQTTIMDNLLHLLLPSDEFYYTNHSTAFARYIKYHAARVAVYLGQLHRIGGRVDLFDFSVFRARRDQASALTLYDSEDTFIDAMALGHVFVNDSASPSAAYACTAEVLVQALLCALQLDKQTADSRLLELIHCLRTTHRCLSLSTTNTVVQPVDLRCDSLKMFVSTLPMLIHPVILIRLLMHRLFGSMVRKSNASAVVLPAATCQPAYRRTVAHPNVPCSLPNTLSTNEKTPMQQLEPDVALSPTSRAPHAQALAYKAAIDAGFNVIAPWENRRKSPVARAPASNFNIELECVSELSPSELRQAMSIGAGRARSNSRSLRLTKSFRTRREQIQLNVKPTCAARLHIASNAGAAETTDTSDQNCKNEATARNDEDVDPEALNRNRKRSAFRWPRLQRKSQVGPPPNMETSCIKNASSFCAKKVPSDWTQFQRELMNLPTFGFIHADVAACLSPGLSRSSTSPNLATQTQERFRFLPHRHADTEKFQKVATGAETTTRNTLLDCKQQPTEAMPEQCLASQQQPLFSQTSWRSQCLAKPSQMLASAAAHIHLTELAVTTPPRCVRERKMSLDFQTRNVSHALISHEGLAKSSKLAKLRPSITGLAVCKSRNDKTCLLSEKQQRKRNSVSTLSASEQMSAEAEVLENATDGKNVDQCSYAYAAPNALGGSSAAQNASQFNEPVYHAVMMLIDTWISTCESDFRCALVVGEMREFLKLFASLGLEFKQWSQTVVAKLKHISERGGPTPHTQTCATSCLGGTQRETAGNRLSTSAKTDTPSVDDTDEYKKLCQLVLAGKLPCNVEDAAALAAINMHIEHAWPQNAAPGPHCALLSDFLSTIRKQRLPRRKFERRSYRSKTPRNEDKGTLLLENGKPLISAHFSALQCSRALLSRCSCFEDVERLKQAAHELRALLNMYLPPEYHDCDKIEELIREKMQKLWHTPFYDNEAKVKLLFIKKCKSLPAYDCKLFDVRELRGDKFCRSSSCILGVGADRVVLLDQKSKQLLKSVPKSELLHWNGNPQVSVPFALLLEFRGNRKPWKLAAVTNEIFRYLMASLCEQIQIDLHHFQLGKVHHTLDSDGTSGMLTVSSDFEQTMLYSEELERLRLILHFPDEVALALSETEIQLYKQIPSPQYVRYVAQSYQDSLYQCTVTSTKQKTRCCSCSMRPHSSDSTCMEDLIQRMAEVSSWIVYIIIMQPSHEDRRQVLQCIVRIMVSCLTLGNFNTVVEILVGLRSDKLKPFWQAVQSACQMEIDMIEELYRVFLIGQDPSLDYRYLFQLRVQMKDCPCLPFFGTHVQQLIMLDSVPSAVVASDPDQLTVHCSEFASDNNSTSNNEDKFASKICVTGLINLTKLPLAQAVLDDINNIKEHCSQALNMKLWTEKIPTNAPRMPVRVASNNTPFSQFATTGSVSSSSKMQYIKSFKAKKQQSFGSCASEKSSEESDRGVFKAEEDYPMNYEFEFPDSKSALLSTQPQTFGTVNAENSSNQNGNTAASCLKTFEDCGIQVVSAEICSLSQYASQILNHGLFALRFDGDSVNSTVRSQLAFLRVDKALSAFFWCKAGWSGSSATNAEQPSSSQHSSTQSNCNSGLAINEAIEQLMRTKSITNSEQVYDNFEEGWLDFLALKDIRFVDLQSSVLPHTDLLTVAKKYGLLQREKINAVTITLLYGVGIVENKCVNFIVPARLGRLWYVLLNSLMAGIKRQRALRDKRISWLKRQYVRLFHTYGLGPNAAQAVRLFGGRRWSTTTGVCSAAGSSGSLTPAMQNKSGSGSASINLVTQFRQRPVTPSGTMNAISDFDQSRINVAARISSAIHQHWRSAQRHFTISIGSGRTQHENEHSRRDSRVAFGTQPSTAAGSSCSIHMNSKKLSAGNMVSPAEEWLCTRALCLQYPLATCTLQGSVLQAPSSNCTIVLPLNRPALLMRPFDELLAHPDGSTLAQMQEQGDPTLTRVRRKLSLGRQLSLRSKVQRPLTHTSELDFWDFVDLFKSFNLHSRKDLRDLFDHVHVLVQLRSKGDEEQLMKVAPHVLSAHNQGVITRVPTADEAQVKRRKICDALAVSSIMSNSVQTGRSSRENVLLLGDLKFFLETVQHEPARTSSELVQLVQQFEPDAELRSKNCLSWKGFANMMMDRDNYEMDPLRAPNDDEMDYPLSHYYIASSHNTYLTGHQFKGESSVELYRQVLLSGCRCVELDCWDGEDGWPVIYHGRTLTTKISFQAVIEAINQSAFVASPYPVILSLENHCSIAQQQRIVNILVSTFGDRLVTKCLFAEDFLDEPYLPSPLQLKYKILVKTKRVRAQNKLTPRAGNLARAATISNRNSIVSCQDALQYDDENDDDEDDEDDPLDDAVQSVANNTLLVSYSNSSSQNPNSACQKPSRLKQSIDMDCPAMIRQRSCSETKTLMSASSDDAFFPANKALNGTKLASLAGTASGCSNFPSGPTGLLRQRLRSQYSEAEAVQTDDELCKDGAPQKTMAKQRHQTSPKLSDLAPYLQTIKFPGFNASPPQSIAQSRFKRAARTLLQPTVSNSMALINELQAPPVNHCASPQPAISAAHPASSRDPAFSTSSREGMNKEQATCKDSIIPSTVCSFILDSPDLASYPTPICTNRLSANVSQSQTSSSMPRCRQICSLNETKAKQITRRFSSSLGQYTERCLFRTYPHAARIDSSNYNPVNFWLHGIQMCALNYQTDDVAMLLNAALFETTANVGYVLKPSVLRSRQHPLFGRFNPLDRDNDVVAPIMLTVQVISGQYVCNTTVSTARSFPQQTSVHNNTGALGSNTPNAASSASGNPQLASPVVEVELIGLPCDSQKFRTKPVQRNAVNPIWNETWRVQVNFPELSFLRFSVYDSYSGHVIAQRIVLLAALRAGYRHVRLRTPQNNLPLELATLFICTQKEDITRVTPMSPEKEAIAGAGTPTSERETAQTSLFRLDSIGMKTKRRKSSERELHNMHLEIHGVMENELVKVSVKAAEATVGDVIAQALAKSKLLCSEAADDFVISEETCMLSPQACRKCAKTRSLFGQSSTEKQQREADYPSTVSPTQDCGAQSATSIVWWPSDKAAPLFERRKLCTRRLVLKRKPQLNTVVVANIRDGDLSFDADNSNNNDKTVDFTAVHQTAAAESENGAETFLCWIWTQAVAQQDSCAPSHLVIRTAKANRMIELLRQVLNRMQYNSVKDEYADETKFCIVVETLVSKAIEMNDSPTDLDGNCCAKTEQEALESISARASRGDEPALCSPHMQAHLSCILEKPVARSERAGLSVCASPQSVNRHRSACASRESSVTYNAEVSSEYQIRYLVHENYNAFQITRNLPPGSRLALRRSSDEQVKVAHQSNRYMPKLNADASHPRLLRVFHDSVANEQFSSIDTSREGTPISPVSHESATSVTSRSEENLKLGTVREFRSSTMCAGSASRPVLCRSYTNRFAVGQTAGSSCSSSASSTTFLRGSGTHEASSSPTSVNHCTAKQRLPCNDTKMKRSTLKLKNLFKKV